MLFVFCRPPPCPSYISVLCISRHKLTHSLLSGEYAQPPASAGEDEPVDAESTGVRPRMLKNVAGKGHPEFSTASQQDAMEFWQHILEQLGRASRAAGHADPSLLFSFAMEERLECGASGMVRYSDVREQHLPIVIDEGDATNVDAFMAYREAVQTAEAANEKVRVVFG